MSTIIKRAVDALRASNSNEIAAELMDAACEAMIQGTKAEV